MPPLILWWWFHQFGYQGQKFLYEIKENSLIKHNKPELNKNIFTWNSLIFHAV